MGEKLGTRSSIWKGVSAENCGMTPKVGRAWKLSCPSLVAVSLKLPLVGEKGYVQDVGKIRLLGSNS